MRRTVPVICATAIACGLATAAPASAVNVLYTVESDAPNVSIAWAPGYWQDYTLEYSNLAGRYSLTLNTSPVSTPDHLFVAARGSGKLHCRIRVGGEVVVADNDASVVVCRA
ncbi:hypothetical protein GONAM_16_00100 [Gordonia namibiensis NBRC 108229]|uniref:Mycobacterium membrane protein n=1 Tax=Gordonia namibiensis NBRC 108229 TaxID=1208314 RepID=K6WM85_9ACTN|nr:hypothetical protein [Gordonia namibiensis]GAC00511.1 hypothetical protein GONAM_16_00100 [Gordonia namibiensis NBRC 108229]